MVLKFEANRLLFLKIVQQGKRETVKWKIKYKIKKIKNKKQKK